MTDELDPVRLQRLLDATARLPHAIEPVRDAWPAIRDRIEAGRVRPIATTAPEARAGQSRRVAWFAAAAVLLIVASSGLTALLLQSRNSVSVAAAPAVAPEVPAAPHAAPPMLAPAPGARAQQASLSPIDPVFARYDAAAADLAAELHQRRAQLDPRVVAVLDSCLTRIDAAIAEARTALRSDPRNAVVTQLLTVTYQQKLDLLRRAASLPAGSH